MDAPVFLVGMMGAGKSYWAKTLSRMLHLPWRDSDEEIIKQQGKSIAAIFESEGEAAFRKYEAAWLDAMERQPVIVATGGGLPVYQNQMQRLLAMGTVIYLETSYAGARARVGNIESRPLWTNRVKWEQLLAARAPIYQQSHFIVNVDTGSSEVVLQQLLHIIQSR